MPQLINPITKQTVDIQQGQETQYPGWTTSTAPVSNPTFKSITPESLMPEPVINLNPQQPDATNYQGIISGGLETANAALARANKPPIAQDISINGMLAGLTGGDTPPSGASLYEQTYGVGPTQAEISTKQETERKATEDLDLLNAQMKAINAEATAIPIKVEKDYAGRASMSAIEGMSRAQLRDLALRALPLEGQILAQQAVLTGSQRALSLASEKFDKIFQLRMADQDRQYDYMKEQRAMIYDRLTKKEQQQIDAMNKADDIKREEYKSNSAQAQKLSQDALDNGQADIAAQITALDPKSATFQQDLANLQGKIIDKKSIQEKADMENKLAQAGYQYVDTPLKRDQLKAQGYDILQQADANGVLKTYAKPPAPVKASGGNNGNPPIGITKAQISQIEQGLISQVGADGFVSPEDYTAAKQDWIQAGGEPSAFDTKFKGRKNPDNPYYPITKSASSNTNSLF